MKKKLPQEKVIKLEDRISHLLNEIRIVLPGTQVFLGFQFASVFTDRFHSLSQSLRSLHLVSLFLVLLAVIFLLSTPAYNRIVERDKATEHFHDFASRMVLLALVFWELG